MRGTAVFGLTMLAVGTLLMLHGDDVPPVPQVPGLGPPTTRAKLLAQGWRTVVDLTALPGAPQVFGSAQALATKTSADGLPADLLLVASTARPFADFLQAAKGTTLYVMPYHDVLLLSINLPIPGYSQVA